MGFTDGWSCVYASLGNRYTSFTYYSTDVLKYGLNSLSTRFKLLHD